MLGSAASNATLVKTRIKYANLLTPASFRRLMECADIGEIAETLSRIPPYDRLLADAGESVLHRGNLEALLRKAAFWEMLQLCRFDSALGSHYFDYIIRQSEMRQLNLFLRLFAAGRPEEYALSLSDYLRDHSKIPLEKLPSCRTFHQVLEVLEGSPLKRAIAPFQPKAGGNLDIPMLESALQRHLFTFLFSLIRRDFQGKAAEELEALYGMQADLKNIQLVLRESRYFTSSPDVIRSQLLPFGYRLSKSKRQALCECRTMEEIAACLQGTYYGRLLPFDLASLDRQCDRLLYDQAKRNMSFSPHPPVVLASYWLLSQLELEDVTTVIEGVRYRIPPEETATFLIAQLDSKAGDANVN